MAFYEPLWRFSASRYEIRVIEDYASGIECGYNTEQLMRYRLCFLSNRKKLIDSRGVYFLY